VATDWWATTDDLQPDGVLGRMMTVDDVAEAMLWMLSRPDHVQVGEVVLHNARSPWSLT
jgi:NADP-dependent 3-hydroxy acid dehydrogenase YdfG